MLLVGFKKKLLKQIKVPVISVLFISLVVLVSIFFNVYNLLKQTTSEDILYITPTINSFSGKIEKIDGNIFTISRIGEVGVKPELPNQDIKSSFPPKKLTFNVSIREGIKIYKIYLPIPYLFKKTSDTSINPGLKDFEIGDEITVETISDLRLLKKNEFLATTIYSAPPSVRTLTAKIIDINENTLNVYNSENAITYTINITSNTEISRMIPADRNRPSLPELLSQKDLKKGMDISFTINGALSSSKYLNALLIQPVYSATSSSQTITPLNTQQNH